MLKRLLNVLVPAIAGAMLFGAVIAVWSASSCHPEYKAEQTDPKQSAHKKRCDAFDISPFKGVGIFLQDNATEIFTAATAIATVFIAFFTLTLRQATLGLKASTDLLWKAGEIHSERELRAFVFVSAANIMPETEVAHSVITGSFVTKIKAWRIGIIWQNGGSTRTKNMECRLNREFFDGEMPDTYEFPDQGDMRRFPTLLGPNAHMLSAMFRFEPNEVREVHAKKKHLYVYGWAEYDDIFPNTTRHRTEFCFEVFFVGDPFPDGTTVLHQLHRLHNAADEECSRPLKTPRT